MIVSEKRNVSVDAFKELMKNTDDRLNHYAAGNESYFAGRNGLALETDVYEALVACAYGTPFEGTIELISGASFPDIIAKGVYGVEVKSTKDNKWKSIGSSILESTRNQNVNRIYLTFGKLGRPIQFLSRPYEECLSGISVTHYPRYQIDMELGIGETIFDKMHIPYDELRVMDNPVKPVAEYYKSTLSEGESLWWAPDAKIEETSSPMTIKVWSSLTKEQKINCQIKAYTLFPELIRSKYDRYSMWLVTNCGIVDAHIRDQFSAGGRVSIVTTNNEYKYLPAVYGKIFANHERIAESILCADASELMYYWGVDEIEDDRISQWIRLVALFDNPRTGYDTASKVLFDIFSGVAIRREALRPNGTYLPHDVFDE